MSHRKSQRNRAFAVLDTFGIGSSRDASRWNRGSARRSAQAHDEIDAEFRIRSIEAVSNVINDISVLPLSQF
jgi:hypothetical protein